MNQVAKLSGGLPAMSKAGIEKVRRLEDAQRNLPQIEIETTHHLHAGLYSRTIRMPAGASVTGALIKIPTLLNISGHVEVFIGDECIELNGYYTLEAAAGRKQAYRSYKETWLTMSFATDAKTVEEAEAEFTDETELLLSRRQGKNLAIGGEK